MLINLLVLYDMPEDKMILQTVCKKIIGLILCKLYKSKHLASRKGKEYDVQNNSGKEDCEANRADSWLIGRVTGVTEGHTFCKHAYTAAKAYWAYCACWGNVIDGGGAWNWNRIALCLCDLWR